MMSVSVYSEYQCVSYYTCVSSQYGDSALMNAAVEGYTEVVVELIKAGANLNLQNKVQRLSILCMFTTYIQHMMYMNKTTLHVIFSYRHEILF